jgi:epoxyqueuosine reductase
MLEWLASLEEKDFEQTFNGSPVRRAGFQGLRRNVAVAMGNQRAERFREPLEKMAQSPEPIVAEHAHWALAQLESK